jgi:hypothetical protein
MSLTASIALGFSITDVDTADLGAESFIANLSRAIAFANGTGANQANVGYAATRSLALGANEVLDLYASGTLLNLRKDVLTMAALKFLFVRNLSPTQALLIGGGTTPVGLFANASDIMTLPALGTTIFHDPSAGGIVLTTNKNLKFEFGSTGATHTYEIIALGLD